MVFKKIKAYRDYMNSSYKVIYENIADRHQVSAFRVYLLAHGIKAQNKIDNEILKELFDEGLISAIKP